MTKVAFVSSSDKKYFPMLLEWVHCLRAFPQSAGMDICVMNAGMTAKQLEILRPLVTKIFDVDWPCHIPAHKIRGREYLKACVARPFIPQYLPDYDVYFWMDSDTWVQRWDAIDMFLKGAERGKIALTGQVDRAYPRQLRVKWLGRWPWKVRGFYFSNIGKAFGFRAARDMMPYHVLLAGAFAMQKYAPHWARWQELVKIAVRKGKVFTAEQTALGMLYYREKYKFELLPAWTHWLCQFKPQWDEGRQVFVEPFLPHEEIGILHLSGWDQMRTDRSVKTDFETTDGGTVNLSYRYPRFDGEAAAGTP